MNEAYRIKGMSELDDSKISCWKADNGEWLFYIPNCGVGGLNNHKVEEHEDGRISVTPSILFTGHRGGEKITRHGYITNGIWIEV
jgi:hypothetical protein